MTQPEATLGGFRPTLDRNLAFELARVTEAAALAAARWMGRGDKNAADQAAVNAMRVTLSSVDMDGIIVIGEGEKDEAPMLYIGEEIGNGLPPRVDVAVDPLDLTVVILDRPRHAELVEQVRKAGARIKFITDGDVAGGIMPSIEGTGVDMLLGVGGSPEAVVTACALKCLGGEIQCKLWP